MNKTEAAYAQRLELLKRAGEILDYMFEPLKLRLADNTFYTPDFLVVRTERLELHEVKGFWRDDARVKWKVAAEQYWIFAWAAVRRKSGVWTWEWYGDRDNPDGGG